MTVFFNNKFAEDDKVVLSPFDRGFIFADGVYEVIRFYNGKLFLLDDHMKRLSGNLQELDIHYDEFDNIYPVIRQLISKNKLEKEDGIIYIQISRGVQYPRNRIYVNEELQPSIFISVSRYPVKRNPAGVSVMTEIDYRWGRCDIKSTMLLSSVMASNKACKSGFDEVLWHDTEYVFEGSHTNIFFVKNNRIFTPALNKKVLPGVTRTMVIKILKDTGMDFSERGVLLDEALGCSECFITGTMTEITPVYRIDDIIIGNGKTGEVTEFIQSQFYKECSNPENLSL